jgi:GNAT superfamily N-acetyltransferase
MEKLIVIQEITLNDVLLLNQVETLFVELYEYIKPKGLALPLLKNGEKLWMESVKNTLGNYSTVIVAIDNGRVIGFAYGMLKFLPDYLGGNKVGVITHFFVVPTYRNMQVGKQLCTRAMKWFESKEISSIEVQIAAVNPDAEKFWKRMGFQFELMQLRKC